MRDAFNGRKSAIAVLIGGALLFGMLPATTLAHEPPGQDRFMYALGQVELGGSYTAYNPTSGAYGKYQIIPSSWRAWAERYLGNAYAAQTPTNQEKVARAKIHDLYWWLGSWPVVAEWWLTGSADKYRSSWSSYARSYVDKIMAIYNGTTASRTSIKWYYYQETSKWITWKGEKWAPAPYPSYLGDNARWTNVAGHTAAFVFTGKAWTWHGPKGPTRGKAKVYVDGVYYRTVDAYASSFKARNVLLTINWPSSGRHVVTVAVVGTPGRPTIAIDAFAVVP